MNEWAIFLSKYLLGWLVIQVCLSFVFLRCLHSHQTISLPDEQLPKTAVILCLRGADPFLGNCLRSLIKQNYPHYDLKLIVDSQEDPAWQIAVDTVLEQGATNVQISRLRIIRKNCSLKCSSLIQAVSELDNSYQVVALVDADTVTHPNWLRELVTPLTHPKIGATTGNRWYLPTGRYWGSLVRYIWNVSAVVQMYLYGIPWGGTLAIKTEVLHQTGLLEKWGQAYGEDTMIRSVLAQHGMQVRFVPSLIMLNREECDLPSLRYWLQRQLLSSRLYHPWWWFVVGDAILTILTPTLVTALFFLAFLSGEWYAAALCLTCFVSYMTGLVLLMLFLEQGVQRVIRSHGEPTAKLSVATVVKMLIATLLTQWVYGLAMISSFRMPTVTWRGVTYRVRGPWNIRLLEYRPYQFLDQPGDKISL
ncbi:MAG: glycosyltransferase family 2 protein [Desmonostoc vinosum HA7617-LM4]|jgi:cellulose synthase/poly-beta-1,6-N-acetylglucosamine synthase-like glycosyltransferase|nr:glycosyltransferase family 2 protein [Desmonostoc vinosum HA7617-LM4]